MGLTLHVYRWSLGDCSNGGFSGRYDAVVCVNVEGPSEPTEDRPAAMLVPGNAGGTVRVIPAERVRRCIECGTIGDESAEPICRTAGFTGGHAYADEWIEQRHGDAAGPMMGGAYVATSDSRFTAAVEEITGVRFYGAVAFHDRYE